MIVSSKGRYALIVMIDLARHSDEGYIPLREIATRQKISEKYLESILRELVKNGLLSGIRGKGGGYKLMRSPEEYTAWDIISVAEEGISTVACLEMNGQVHCPNAAACDTLPMWKDFSKTIHEFFSGYTLAELAKIGA